MHSYTYALILLPFLAASAIAIWAATWRTQGVRGLKALATLRQKRVRVDIDAVIQAGRVLERCRVLDISGGGVLTRVKPSLEITEGDEVRLTFEYAGMQLVLDARVIHKEKKGPLLCGMQFIEPSVEPEVYTREA